MYRNTVIVSHLLFGVCKYFVTVVDVTPTGFADWGFTTFYRDVTPMGFADWGFTTFYRDVTPTGLKRKQGKNWGYKQLPTGI